LPLKSITGRDVKREVMTLADSARQVQAQLPGQEGENAFRPAAAPMPRFTVVARDAHKGEQLSVRATKAARAELDELLGQLRGDNGRGAEMMRVALLAADCFARQLVPGLLRHLEHDDLASALENLPEVTGTRGVERIVSVFSSLTYLLSDDAAQVFYAAIDALEQPAHAGTEEIDRRSPAVRPFRASFSRSLAAAINRADRVLSSETSGTDDALPHPLRPSVEVATVVGNSKLRSLAS
jgi:hypothetical protein